jgi:cytochrome c oxidase cbb3-type subunit IV
MDWQAILEFFSALRVVWFALLFAGIVAWAYWPRRRDRLESYGRIPLEDGED